MRGEDRVELLGVPCYRVQLAKVQILMRAHKMLAAASSEICRIKNILTTCITQSALESWRPISVVGYKRRSMVTGFE